MRREATWLRIGRTGCWHPPVSLSSRSGTDRLFSERYKDFYFFSLSSRNSGLATETQRHRGREARNPQLSSEIGVDSRTGFLRRTTDRSVCATYRLFSCQRAVEPWPAGSLALAPDGV